MVLTFSLISSVLVIVVGSVEYNSINKGYTFNSTCQNSFECRGKLICLELTCRCSVELIWNGTNCIMRKQANELCNTSEECQSSLLCHRQICQCISSDYWNGTTCKLSKIQL
ncbi:uncharacterized protein LOC134683633 isoform X2 [Mytilus trossulus]|uniref:uncharacterized protein LOC134683633 isoform X2 n=1 Tax=Mytilus trossulus TaxID=6551 RepID=UPI003004991B